MQSISLSSIHTPQVFEATNDESQIEKAESACLNDSDSESVAYNENQIQKIISLEEIRASVTKIQSLIRGYQLRSKPLYSTHQETLKVFGVNYVDPHSNQRLYFRLKIILIDSKNLFKVVLRELKKKHFNYIIKKVPEEISHLQSNTDKAYFIQSRL